MKQFLLILLSIITFMSFAQKSKGYEIIGNITNADGKKIYLATQEKKSKFDVFDSCIVANNNFVFKGNLDEPIYAFLLLGEPNNNRGVRAFILDNNILTFRGDADSLRTSDMSGSIELDLILKFDSIIYTSIRSSDFLNLKEELSNAQRDGDENKANAANAQLNKLFKGTYSSVGKELIEKYPDTFFSLTIFFRLYNFFEFQEALKLFNGLSERMKNHSTAKDIRNQFVKFERLYSHPLLIEEADSIGKMISTEKLKGKYVLVDFWASWCPPCRTEIPYLKKAYELYKKKGFEIYSVSLDNDKSKWINSIENNKIEWIQVSDLNGWDNKYVREFEIKSIPTNFLLDKTGKIIAFNLRGENLLNKLSEILD